MNVLTEKSKYAFIVRSKYLWIYHKKILFFIFISTIVYVSVTYHTLSSDVSHGFHRNSQVRTGTRLKLVETKESRKILKDSYENDGMQKNIEEIAALLLKKRENVSSSTEKSFSSSKINTSLNELFLSNTSVLNQRDKEKSLNQSTAYYKITQEQDAVRTIEIVTTTSKYFNVTKNSSFENLKHERNITTSANNVTNNSKSKNANETTNSTILYDWKWKLNRLYEEVNEYWKGVTNQSYYTEQTPLLPKQNRSVIIITNYRSGSTFLGQIFNQNPDVFYVFEPFYPFGLNRGKHSIKKIQLLPRYIKCDFPPIKDVYDQVINPKLNYSVAIECLYNNFCFRDKMKHLCKREYCSIPEKSCEFCGPVHLRRAMNLCRSKKLSVIKTIRLDRLDALKPVMEDPTLDIKVIYLVRDPRGIMSSRLKIEPRDISYDSQIDCKIFKNNIETIKELEHYSWLKDHLLIVRYEDLAINPLKLTKSIYRFVGLPLVKTIKDWIKTNTKISIPTNATVKPFTTKRNSAAAMQGWREHLTIEQVKVIQSFCTETLKFYGYRKVETKQELENLDALLF